MNWNPATPFSKVANRNPDRASAGSERVTPIGMNSSMRRLGRRPTTTATKAGSKMRAVSTAALRAAWYVVGNTWYVEPEANGCLGCYTYQVPGTTYHGDPETNGCLVPHVPRTTYHVPRPNGASLSCSPGQHPGDHRHRPRAE